MIPDNIKAIHDYHEQGINLDIALDSHNVTHQAYRKHYPDAPLTSGLAIELLDMTDEYSIKQIERRWSLTRSQVTYLLYNPAAFERDKTNPTKLRVLNDLRNTTDTQLVIAKRHCASQSLVHQVAKNHGLLKTDRKDRVILTVEQAESIPTLRKTHSVAEIAEMFSVSRDAIYKQLRSRDG